ncbi:hypothetical protein [Celeribacter naphthalenivorans]|uniref:hypothetical protein n=1 Tax=Celeribacter naphthalenivorans TaxID=1614694 RepID=UPI001CF936A8|nr:hypothetical protein [Celeribacter naphthalenivorans]
MNASFPNILFVVPIPIIILLISWFFELRFKRLEKVRAHLDSANTTENNSVPKPEWWREYFRLSGTKPDDETSNFFYVSLIEEMKQTKAVQNASDQGILFEDLTKEERQSLIGSIHVDQEMHDSALAEIASYG